MLSDVYCRQYVWLLLLFCSYCYVWTSLADEDVDSSIKLGDACNSSDQCNKSTPNSTCADGYCACIEGFFTIKKLNISFCESDSMDATDEDYTRSSTPPKVHVHKVDLNMVIIMIVLSVMFIGICVALHLFSKARFRNHRTIFNSPHPRLMHIKLGKKKGRRRASHTSLEVPGSRQLSICSQLSPIQSRRGSQATSPDFSHKTRKSNGDKKETSHAHRQPRVDSDKGASRTTDSPANITNGPGSPTVIVANSKSAPHTSASARV